MAAPNRLTKRGAEEISSCMGDLLTRSEASELPRESASNLLIDKVVGGEKKCFSSYEISRPVKYCHYNGLVPISALQPFRGVETPGGVDCFLQDFRLRELEENAGRATASPCSFDRDEGVGVILGKIVLVFRRKLDHGSSLVGIAEGGEDFSRDAEVRMGHVRTLFGLGK